jgi:hypothetical protein
MHGFEVEARNGDIPVDYNQQAFFILASILLLRGEEKSTRFFLTHLLITVCDLRSEELA